MKLDVPLEKALALLDSPKEVELFLRDLCTHQEYESFQGRWKVVQLVEENVPYRKIYEITGVSTATVSRVAQSLTRGEGGYRSMLDRLKQKKIIKK